MAEINFILTKTKAQPQKHNFLLCGEKKSKKYDRSKKKLFLVKFLSKKLNYFDFSEEKSFFKKVNRKLNFRARINNFNNFGAGQKKMTAVLLF